MPKQSQEGWSGLKATAQPSLGAADLQIFSNSSLMEIFFLKEEFYLKSSSVLKSISGMLIMIVNKQ